MSVTDMAELLGVARSGVQRLINDWAFGDPSRLPTLSAEGNRPTRLVPTERFQAFLDGNRQYPPGDPRGQQAGASTAGASS
ncbi:hypothetical protein [Actinomycetospora aeridis]|uniref:Helix-turn-helix domain-containing protein n=1 Tax=Actinomycetospora aeridis TaxID=3129231 RepID=A0ABU8N2B4_9PSEU